MLQVFGLAARANSVDLFRRRREKASYLDTLFALSTGFLFHVRRRAQAINVDPDQKLTEYHICSKYSDSQVRANSVYPDRTPVEYRI